MKHIIFRRICSVLIRVSFVFLIGCNVDNPEDLKVKDKETIRKSIERYNRLEQLYTDLGKMRSLMSCPSDLDLRVINTQVEILRQMREETAWLYAEVSPARIAEMLETIEIEQILESIDEEYKIVVFIQKALQEGYTEKEIRDHIKNEFDHKLPFSYIDWLFEQAKSNQFQEQKDK